MGSEDPLFFRQTENIRVLFRLLVTSYTYHHYDALRLLASSGTSSRICFFMQVTAASFFGAFRRRKSKAPFASVHRDCFIYNPHLFLAAEVFEIQIIYSRYTSIVFFYRAQKCSV